MTLATIDLDFVRAAFPALDSSWALFDNAGGSVPARHVTERVVDYMSRLQVQHGASYGLSRDALAAVEAGRAAIAQLFNARADEIVFGSSATMLTRIVCNGLAPSLQAGDEVVVTNLDHEANVGPWRALEARGVVVREWRFRDADQRLALEDLEPLLGPRTKLVAFTHCANVVGSIHDAQAICARVRAAGALSCVDGVAYAPHRRVDVQALGCDFYLASLYKIYGPHMGALFGRRDALLALRGQNHGFVPEDAVPYKLEPGNAPHELAAGLTGIVAYLTELDRHHGGPGELESAFELISRQEEALAAQLLGFLNAHPRVRVIGETSADRALRVPTVAFVVDGMDSAALPPKLDEQHLAVRYGHFYATRAIRDMGLDGVNGIVRASMLHYTTPDEVARLIDALERAL